MDSGPADKATLIQEDAVKYYRQMLAIRRMETAAGNLYKEKAIRGFCHLYSGQVGRILVIANLLFISNVSLTIQFMFVINHLFVVTGSCLRWHESCSAAD